MKERKQTRRLPKAIAPSISEPTFPMRINKFLAWKKEATRRDADILIEKKQVSINGRIAVLGDKVNENDLVEVHFRGPRKKLVYFAYNKPIGIVTHSPRPSETDIEHSIKMPGVFPVGRLDKESHGLIILTNDGRIIDPLLSPTRAHEKEYIVTTKEPLRSSFKGKMEAGVRIEKEMTRPCKVRLINDTTFRVVLTEGKKHQIRRMCVALFQNVEDLKRVRIMNIELGTLPEGKLRPIEGAELTTFLQSLGINE